MEYIDFDQPLEKVVERVRVLEAQGHLDDMTTREAYDPARARANMAGLVLRCADGQEPWNVAASGMYYGP